MHHTLVIHPAELEINFNFLTGQTNVKTLRNKICIVSFVTNSLLMRYRELITGDLSHGE